MLTSSHFPCTKCPRKIPLFGCVLMRKQAKLLLPVWENSIWRFWWIGWRASFKSQPMFHVLKSPIKSQFVGLQKARGSLSARVAGVGGMGVWKYALHRCRAEEGLHL